MRHTGKTENHRNTPHSRPNSSSSRRMEKGETEYNEPGTRVLKGDKTTGVVILLHGLGDTSEGWSFEMRSIHKKHSHIKFILPTAPVQPVTINRGMRCTSWYDIKSLTSRDEEDYNGLAETTERITAIIEKEVKGGIPASRIILGGFSQGAAVSMHIGYHYPETLSGVIALSGYLPIKGEEDMFEINSNAKRTPLFLGHGTADQVVKYEWGKASYEALVKAGVQGVMKTYQRMGHSSCQEEMKDVAKFIAEHLPE